MLTVGKTYILPGGRVLTASGYAYEGDKRVVYMGEGGTDRYTGKIGGERRGENPTWYVSERPTHKFLAPNGAIHYLTDGLAHELKEATS